MAKFTYTAVKEGKPIHGRAEAATQDILITMLERQGIKPLVVKEEGKKRGLITSLALPGSGKKVKQKDLVVFSRQLSVMISAGVPLTRCMATLQEQAANKYFKTVIGNIAKDIESGLPLSAAFSKYPNIFNDVYTNMVQAGESGGILDDILKRLAAQVEAEASMRKKIKSAMTYPAVIFTIMIIAFFGIMIFVIPKIGEILKELGGEDAKLPIYTQIMLNLSDFMRQNAIILAILFIAAAIAFRRFIKTPKGKLMWHGFLLRVPVVKMIVTKIAIARFSRTFAALMSAGVSVLDSLQVTGGAIGNKVIQNELIEAAKEVKNGKPLSEPISKSKHFPPIVAQMLAVGEETGQIDTILVKVADFYEEEVNAVIDGLASIIEPVMIILLGAMVGLIAASVMGPIASLSQNIGNE